MNDIPDPASVQTWIQIITNFGVTNVITWLVGYIVYRYAVQWFVDSNKRQVIFGKRQKRILSNQRLLSRVLENAAQHFAQKAGVNHELPSNIAEDLRSMRRPLSTEDESDDEGEDE